jgi:hypothetical protein
MVFDRCWKRKTLLLGFALFLGGLRLSAQATGRQAIGSLQTRGSVSVEGIPATSEVSLYPGDTVRTGADGAGSFVMPNRGTLVIGANTEITFLSGAPGARLASLHRGNIALRLGAQESNTTIELGKFALTTEANNPASAEIDMSADGSAHVRCLGGSVGVIEVEGMQAIFLKPGEGIEATAAGNLRRVVSAAPSEPTSGAPSSNATPTKAGKSHNGLIMLGVGGGVAGGVAALLAIHHGQPMSPAAP